MVTVKMKRGPRRWQSYSTIIVLKTLPLNAAADVVNFRRGRPDIQRSPALKRSCAISLFGLDT
jgi:hypothetical protein